MAKHTFDISHKSQTYYCYLEENGTAWVYDQRGFPVCLKPDKTQVSMDQIKKLAKTKLKGWGW